MIRIPSKATLKKYGLDELIYTHILEEQGYKCSICKKTPSTGRFYIDHYHQKHYYKLPANLRMLYVRGLLCYFCNRFFVARGIDVEKAENVVAYLKAFEARRPR